MAPKAWGQDPSVLWKRGQVVEPITGAASVLAVAVLIIVWCAVTIERFKHRMRERERARRAAYAAWLFTRKVNRMANQRTTRGWNHV